MQILAELVGVLLLLLANFDEINLMINWKSWWNLKYKKKCNYKSDLIWHNKYRLLSFELTRKTCRGLNFKLSSFICDEEERGNVSNIKTQLDCKYLCANQVEPSTSCDWYRQSAADTSLAPLGQVDEWTAKPLSFYICGGFLLEFSPITAA